MILRGKHGKIIWTDKMISFLKNNHPKMTNRELSDALGLKITAVRHKCYEIGLYRMELEYWTKEQVDFLLAYWQIMGDVEMAEIFNQLWPKKKGWTCKHIEKKRKYLKLKRTKLLERKIRERNNAQGRYSTVKRSWESRPCAKQNEIRIWMKAGRPEVYVKWSGGSFKGNYEKLSYINWILYRGSIPKGMNIIHKDGDTLNCDIDNLEMVSNAELARLNADKSISVLSDSYLAGLMSHKNPALRKILKGQKDLLSLKRAQIELYRILNK